jgi:hypothetical protein
MSPVYKVSYVVSGEVHPGAIINSDAPPEQGERVKIGKREFQVIEVIELVPPRGDFRYLHATVQPVDIALN